MAREFDQLESEVRGRALPRLNEQDYLDLQELLPRETPPPMPTMLDMKRWMDQNPPTGPVRKERAYPVPPGYRERYGDPTKVISEAPAPAKMAGDVKIPEGFSLEPPGVKIPEGFTLTPPGGPAVPTAGMYGMERAPPTPTPPVPTAGTTEFGEGPTPAPMAGISQWSADPNEFASEMAALRMQRAGTAPGGQGAFTRGMETAAEAVGGEALRYGEAAKQAVTTGDLPPEQAIEAATAASPVSAAYRTGRALWMARHPEIMAQRETGVMSIPRAAATAPTALGRFEKGIAETVSGIPGANIPLQTAGARSSEELARAGRAAATAPERVAQGLPARLAEGEAFGEATTQAAAGGVVRTGIEDAVDRAAQYGGKLPPKITGLLNKSDEDIVGSIVKMASEVKTGADARTLGQLFRRSDPDVQSAVIARLGRGTTGEFNPGAWVKNYSALSNEGKNVLFGPKDSPLRYHLDSLEAVARRADSWGKLEKGREALGTRVGVAAGLGAAFGAGGWKALVTYLTGVVPAAMISKALARPATAAPLAQWARAYEGIVRGKGSAAAIGSFSVATKNLANSLGMDFTAEDFFRQAREGFQKAETTLPQPGQVYRGITEQVFGEE